MTDRPQDSSGQNSADRKKTSLLPLLSQLNNLLDRTYRIEHALRRAHYLTVHSVSGKDSALISLGLVQISLLQQEIKDCNRGLSLCAMARGDDAQ